MAWDFNGTNEFLSASNIANIGNYTVAIRWNHDSAQSADAKRLFAWDNYPTTPRVSCLITPRHTIANMRLEAHVDNTGGVTDFSRPSDDAWHHAAMVRSGTTITPYSNGVAQTAITVGSGTFTAENIRVGCHYHSGSNQIFFDGQAAELAIWAEALTVSEIVSLTKGYSASLVHPQNLISYWSLIRELTDKISGNNMSATGGIVTPHPRIIQPCGVF